MAPALPQNRHGVHPRLKFLMKAVGVMAAIILLGFIYASYTDLKNYAVPLYVSFSLASIRLAYMAYAALAKGEGLQACLITGAVLFFVFVFGMVFFGVGGADAIFACLTGLTFGISGAYIVCAALLLVIAALPATKNKKEKKENDKNKENGEKKETKAPYPLIPFITASAIIYLMANFVFSWEKITYFL